MTTKRRWAPIVECYVNDKHWNPREDEVLIAPERDGLPVLNNGQTCKHFKPLEEVLKVKDNFVSHHEHAEAKTKADHGVDSYTPTERLGLIVQAAKTIDFSDRTLWYRSVPKVPILNSKLPFTTTNEEIKQALGMTAAEVKQTLGK